MGEILGVKGFDDIVTAGKSERLKPFNPQGW